MIKRKLVKEIFLITIITLISIASKAQKKKALSENGITQTHMVNSDIDDCAKPWCYLQNSTTVIGVPYMPDAVQITYDGAIYTNNAELCFFYGKHLQPVLQRQKWWYKGWIPIVEYNWESQKTKYEVEMFGFPLAGEDAQNTLQFVKVRITNENTISSKAQFTVAARSTGENNRLGKSIFSPQWIYAIDGHKAIRNGKLIYTFSGNGRLESVVNHTYSGAFSASNWGVKENTAVCLVNYAPLLRPGESTQYIFKMPRVPVDTSNKLLLHKIEHADYTAYKKKTIQYWEDLILKNKATFEIPEKRVNDAVKASLVQMVLATREREGKRFMTDGLPYPNLFLTSFIQHEEAFDFFGLKQFTDQSMPEVYAKQDKDGLFYDGALLHGKILGVAQGQTIQMLCKHYFLTRDKQYIDTVYPKIKAAVVWLKNAILSDKYHLMPPAWPYDNEMILGHYTSNNLWAILGVRSAIRLARDLGKSQDVEQWTQFEIFYRASLLKAVNETFKEKGYLTPGLYDYKMGESAREGFSNWQTNQEWENMLLVSPSELLSPNNPIVDATLKHIRRDRYREGIMTYRIFLHQYITINMMDQELAKGDSKNALIDLYNVILHLGSCYEGFENQVYPWADRKVAADCPTPHAWASSKLVCFLRDMLVREYGGDAGLDENKRNLYLFSLISPDWCKDGQQVVIRDARTEMGILSASMRFTGSGSTIKIDPIFHSLPHRIVITIPYFVHLTRFESDASKMERIGNLLYFSPDVHTINLTWYKDKNANQGTFIDILKRYRSESTLRIVNGQEVIQYHEPYVLPEEKNYPPVPLSFDLVKKAFVREYSNRLKSFVERDGYVDSMPAPPLIPNKPNKLHSLPK
ncbi:hypothetical protein [Arachidicoccus sp.]|uniref:hypothetical protein n=1 Tax=Arachidicoccus sp. TaxID=1872624 RepID=UPI003D1F2422